MFRWLYYFNFKNKKVWFLVWLIFSSTFCAPLPYQKQLNNIIDESAKVGDCIFDNYDKERPEAFPDESKTKVSCGGRMFNLGKIKTHIKPDASHPLFGAKNVVDLLLGRMGNFDVKWDGDEESVLKEAVCENHFNELFWTWERTHSRSTRVGSGPRRPACNYPKSMGQHDDIRKAYYRLSKMDAETIFRAKDKVVHPGIGVCEEHKNEIIAMAESARESEIDREFCLADTGMSDNNNENMDFEDHPSAIVSQSDPKDITAYLAVQNFAKEFDIQRFVSTCKFDTLKADSKRKKINSAKFLFRKIAESVAPNNETFFLEAVCSKFEKPNADAWKHKLLDSVVQQYNKASDDKMLRLYALSTVSNLVSYGEILTYLPNLTYYYFAESRKLQRATKLPKPDEKKIYIRYDAHKIEAFIDFITSPYCLITLPFGQKQVKLNDGTVLDIPHTMRMQRNSDIIRMFKGKMNEEEKADLVLPDSTMYGILKECYAKPAKAMQCVDYYIAAGLEAFETLKEIIEKWEVDQLIDSEMVSDMKGRLDKGQQYLKTDFKVNLKMHSPVKDHDLILALSDPNDSDFSKNCEADQEHITTCERSASLRNILTEVSEMAEQFLEDVQDTEADANEIEEKRRILYQVKEAVTDIEEMKSHLLRSRFSDIQRNQIIENLDEGSVLVTMDWAQKLLAQRKYETQKTYFGKKGMSYHISHLLGKIDGKTVDHSYVHVTKSTKQDNHAVAAILVDALRNAKKMGVQSAIIRADNAGCYHATQLMFSLKQISEMTGVKVTRFSFSEAQNGKSSCDQKASHIKSKVRNYVIQRNKVETEEEFHEALTSPPMTHTTFALSTVQKPAKPDEIKSLPGISTYSEFVMEDNGIRVYKFFQIGPGKFFSYDKYKPIVRIPQLSHESQNNILDGSTITHDSEKDAIQKGGSTSYWRIVKGRKTKQKDNHYHCPENNCMETFDSMAELEHHLLLGNHTLRPEQMTARDYALTYYRENILAAGADYEDLSVDIIRNNVLRDMWSPDTEQIAQGWALKKTRQFPKITVAAKAFLQKIFDDGEKTGVKSSPQKAAKQMSAAKKEGEFLFKAEEILKTGQIQSYFSFLAKEKKKCENEEPPSKKSCPVPNPAEDNYDDEKEEEEESNDDIPDENEMPLRRSNRLINNQNAYIRRYHEQSVDSMVHDAIDPNGDE